MRETERERREGKEGGRERREKERKRKIKPICRQNPSQEDALTVQL